MTFTSRQRTERWLLARAARAVVVAACGMLLAVLAAPAQAGPQWLDVERLSAPDEYPYAYTIDAHVLLNENGDAAAVWAGEVDGVNDGIRARGRPAGAGSPWSPIQPIVAGSAQNPVDIVPGTLQVATNASGEGVAVWQRTAGPLSNWVELAYRRVGGAWVVETPGDAPISGTDNALLPNVSIDPAGNVGAIWVLDPDPQNPGDEHLRFRRRVLAQGWDDAPGYVRPDWDQQAEHIIESGVYPQLQMDNAGNALAVWVNDQDSLEIPAQEQDFLESAFLPAGQVQWTVAYILGPMTEYRDLSDLHLAANAAGSAVAAWRFSPPSGATAVQAAVGQVPDQPGQDYWGDPAHLDFAAVPEDDLDLPSVAIDDSGNAIAVWRYFDASSNVYEVRAKARLAGEEWPQAPRLLSDPQVLQDRNPGAPQVAVNGGGSAVVAWPSVFDNARLAVWGTIGSTDPGDQWETARQRLTPSDNGEPFTEYQGTVDVSVDPEGNAIVGWTSRLDGDDPPAGGGMAVRAFDGAGPSFSSLGIPTEGAVGSPVAFSATVTDVWSEVPDGNIAWDFGDGGSDIGASVSHTYTEPSGETGYVVKVTATDEAGNSRQQTGTIVVAPGPQPEPQPQPQPGPQPVPQPPSVGQAPAGTRVAALSRASMQIRCRRGKSRLASCGRGRGGGQRRVLVASFTASEGARVKISLKAKSAKRGGKRRVKERTVLTRTVAAKAGANRVVLPLPAAARGALTGELSVVGTTIAKKVKVTA